MADGSIGATTRAKGLVTINVGLVGVSPLLMNAMDEATLERLVTGEKAPKGAPKGTPLEQATKKLYTHEGKPVLPVVNVLSSLIEAGRSVRLDGKKQVSTASSTVLPSFMSIDGMHLPLLDTLDNREPATWRVSLMQGRNPNGGEAVGICRPCFDSWAVLLEVVADLDTVPERIVRELFDKAGSNVGVGDFRPQRKGFYGRWRIDRWVIAK